MKLGVANIPEILLDNTDRNRTSPFAFTGNRFEFRAVGSSANCGAAMLALNAAVAEQLMLFKDEVDQRIEKGEPKERVLFDVIKKYIVACKAIRFDGNGYSEEWKSEAAKRGLDCETSVPVVIDRYLAPESIRMFEKTGVQTADREPRHGGSCSESCSAGCQTVPDDVATERLSGQAGLLGRRDGFAQCDGLQYYQADRGALGCYLRRGRAHDRSPA